jgi:hypothetical protein
VESSREPLRRLGAQRLQSLPRGVSRRQEKQAKETDDGLRIRGAGFEKFH